MKKHSVRIGTALMLMLLAATVTFIITFVLSTEYYAQRLEGLEQMENRYAKLRSVSEIVEKYFIADYDETEAVESALAGYVDGLGDYWSTYYTAEETARIAEDNANSYVGIGVTYSTEEETRFQIVSVVEGGPADQAGMQAGDTITFVEDVDVSTLEKASDIAGLVKGERGTVVNLSVDREGERINFSIIRDQIKTYSVSGHMVGDDVGYIAISDFDSDVDEEFLSMLEELTGQGAKAFVFDVRNNPGGYLEVMRAMLDRLLPEGIVITTVDKQGRETPYTSDADCIEAPMAVLVNGSSISAAEFFAAALQEYEVATVVGSKTSGKGYSQQTFLLNDGSSVHISTTRYYTPKGRSLAETGISPDLEVDMTDADRQQLLYGRLAEEDDGQLQAAVALVSRQIVPSAEELPAENPMETETPATGGNE